MKSWCTAEDAEQDLQIVHQPVQQPQVKHEHASDMSKELLCEHKGIVHSVCILPDKSFVSGAFDKTIYVSAKKQFISMPDKVTCICNVPTNNSHCNFYPFAASLTNGTVQVFESENTIYSLGNHKDFVYSVDAIALDDTVLFALGSRDHSLSLWNNKQQQILHVPELAQEWITYVRFINGKLYISSRDGCARIFDLTKQQCVQTYKIRNYTSDPLTGCVGIHGYEHNVLVAVDDKFLYGFDDRHDELVKKLAGHYGIVYNCALHPQNEHQLYTCSSDKTIRLWDYSTAKCLSMRTGHAQEIRTIDVCNDYLVSGSFDKTVKKWEL